MNVPAKNPSANRGLAAIVANSGKPAPRRTGRRNGITGLSGNGWANGVVTMDSPIDSGYATYFDRPLAADGSDTFCAGVVSAVLNTADPEQRERNRQQAVEAYPWCPELEQIPVQHTAPEMMPDPQYLPTAALTAPAGVANDPYDVQVVAGGTPRTLGNALLIQTARIRTRASEGYTPGCSSTPMFLNADGSVFGGDLTDGGFLGFLTNPKVLPWLIAGGIGLVLLSGKKR